MPYSLNNTINLEIGSSDNYVTTILKDLSNFSAQYLSTYNFSLTTNEEYTVINATIPNTFLVAVKGTEALDVSLTNNGLTATAFKQLSVEYQASHCTIFTPLNASGIPITVYNQTGTAYPVVATPDIISPYNNATPTPAPLSVYLDNGSAIVPVTSIVIPIDSTLVETTGNYSKAPSTLFLKIFDTSVGATITQIKVLNSTSTSNIVSVAVAHGLL